MNAKLLFAAAFVAAFSCAAALAQTYRDTAGTAVPAVVPVSPGGGPLFTSSNPGQIAGSFSASLGGFTPSASGARMTPLAVTTSDSSGTLPSGTAAVVSNVGSNPMYCNVNGFAATASDELIPASSWFAFTIPSGVTALHCIATGGSTTANAVGGSGLPTGAGGGGSGGGSVPTGSAGSPNASVVSVQGVTGGYALPVSGTFWQSTQPVSLASLPALAAGSNTIGSIANTSFGISGTLPGFAATPTVALQDASNLCPSGCSLSGTGVFFTADTTGYQSISVELTANAGGNTIVFETSDDNSTWVGANGLPSAATGASGATGTLSTTSASLYRVPVNGRYFRVRLSIYVYGTTTVYAYLHATPANVVTSQPTLAAGTNTIGKVDMLGAAGATMDVAIGGATAATDALQAGGVYNSSAPSLSSGQGAALQPTRPAT